jgi:DNA-binding SARP family transcriptional activator
MRDRIRGAAAAVVLLATTAGLPLTLAATVGNPLHHLASIGADRLSDTDVTAVLAGVFYLAWATFALAVIVELAVAIHARITHRTPRHVRLPLLGTQHDLARRLVSAVVLLMPATSVSFTGVAAAAPAHVLTASTQVQPIDVAPTHAGASHPAHDGAVRRYVIPDMGGLRSYWAIAEKYLGDGLRWREVWRLNQGRVHSDGTVMDTPRRLYAGWTVLIPPDIDEPVHDLADPHDVEVRPGDTLSGITATNGIADWRAVWRINRDRVEPDGSHFSDPNLIRPGWIILLPTPATSAVDQTPHSESTAPSHSNPMPAPNRPASGDIGGKPSPTSEPHPVTAPPRPSADGPSHHEAPVPLAIGLGAIATLAALDRARRMAQRRRRVGHRLPPPPPELREVEAQLRRDARGAHPVSAVIQLAVALSGACAVDIRAAAACDDGAVDLHFDGPVPDPPAPFTALPGRWRLPADAQAFTYPVDEVANAKPLLVPVGRLPEGELLVDLGRVGLVSVLGDKATVCTYLVGLVRALSGAPWAEHVQVHVPSSLADQCAGLARVSVDSAAPSLPTDRPEEPERPSAADPNGHTGGGVHLYCGWDAEDDLERLTSAGASRSGVHTIVVGPCPGAVVWAIEGDLLTLPGIEVPVRISTPPCEDSGAAELIAFVEDASEVPAGDACLPDLAADAPSAHTHGTSVDPLAVTEEGRRQINVLGPVDLTGVRWLRRAQILELLVYLALHRRGADRHQLLGALWPDKPPALKTLRNRITEARALVDGAISDGPRWRLDEAVTTDWQRFTALAAGTREQQREALSLVTGRPFTGLDHCDWLDLEGIRSEVEATIVDTALTVGEADLDAGRYPEALAAARAGLLASRYEERLHHLAIHAAEAQGLTGVVKTLAREMQVALGDDTEPNEAA